MKKLWTLPLFLTSAAAFAETEAAKPAREQNMWQTFIVLGVAIVFFYFILWRPEQKRRKAMAAKRGSLKMGDRVTAMGIIGTVVKMTDDTVILQMYEGGKIEVLKAAVTDVNPVTNEAKSTS